MPWPLDRRGRSQAARSRLPDETLQAVDRTRCDRGVVVEGAGEYEALVGGSF